MSQSNARLDLRDTWGEVHLASALGVGTDAVGGLWKDLRKLHEDSRMQRLEALARELAESTGSAAELGRWHGISSALVKPLIEYYRKSQVPQPRRDWKCYFSDCYS